MFKAEFVTRSQVQKSRRVPLHYCDRIAPSPYGIDALDHGALVPDDVGGVPGQLGVLLLGHPQHVVGVALVGKVEGLENDLVEFVFS